MPKLYVCDIYNDYERRDESSKKNNNSLNHVFIIATTYLS